LRDWRLWKPLVILFFSSWRKKPFFGIKVGFRGWWLLVLGNGFFKGPGPQLGFKNIHFNYWGPWPKVEEI